MPGAGKTILSSAVVDELAARFPSTSGVAVAYIYGNYNRRHEQTPIQLVSSLLKQLVLQLPSIPEQIRDLYDQHYQHGSRPQLLTLIQYLEHIIVEHTRVFFVIDALDELPQDAMDVCIPELLRLTRMTSLRIFATARPVPAITTKFEGPESIRLEIHAIDEDIERYIQAYLSVLPSFVMETPGMEEDIQTSLCKAAGGMYANCALPLSWFLLTTALGFSWCICIYCR
jgi:Cdc6-like AAA superfamily ATPase